MLPICTSYTYLLYPDHSLPIPYILLLLLPFRLYVLLYQTAYVYTLVNRLHTFKRVSTFFIASVFLFLFVYILQLFLHTYLTVQPPTVHTHHLHFIYAYNLVSTIDIRHPFSLCLIFFPQTLFLCHFICTDYMLY